ncbi:alpha-galactosidase [Dactylosporangium matsuzakiense]|uniref:Alpha-galactosidase n=2 Tax=Dactylosporangium matsuzakiense TaxID=53360 RepID=A0A9W6KX71_9ACTN|nr:alpha-galactosidase [Dactylosporangium matsuzakiense]
MSLVRLDHAGRLWALNTPHSTYVIGVAVAAGTDEVAVLQQYWGASLTPSAAREAAAMPAGPGNSSGAGRHETSFSRPAEIEELLPVDGGLRWGVPALQVTVDRVRSLELRFVRVDPVCEDDADRLDITLEDRAFPIEVVLHTRVYTDSDVIARWVTLRHRATRETAVKVSRLDSGSWFVPDAEDYRYRAVCGAWAEEGQLQQGRLPVGELTFTSRQGITGHHANPWIMIGGPDVGEEHGEVWSVALAWSGSWRMTTTRRPEGGTAVTAGFGHEGVRWTLPAGAELVTPMILGRYGADGFGGTSRGWHDHVRRRILPAGDEDRPVLYNSWEATGFEVTAPEQLSLARRAAALGAELFVVDDGWFGRRDDEHSSLGDWWPHRKRFPDGLRGLFDGVRALGMGAGLWVEPEAVSPDSDLYRVHPDWVLHLENRRRDRKRDQLVLNFARAEVRDWALEWLDRLVADLRLDYLKWDMNRPFTQAGWPDSGRSHDCVWIEHTRHIFHTMAALRDRHPGLRLEACAGGGGRLDLGILHYTDQAWPSDNTDPVDRQTTQHGVSQLYPANVMSTWVTDSPNANTGRSTPLRYRFHVAMAGVLGIGADLSRWSPEELEEAGAMVEQYKAVRRTIQHGRQYRLGGRPGVERSGLQYVLDDQVVVLVYNPRGNAKSGPRWLRLIGLDPDALYEVAAGGDPHGAPGRLAAASRWHGSTLMAVGVRPTAWEPIGADYRSDLILLRRIPG